MSKSINLALTLTAALALSATAYADDATARATVKPASGSSVEGTVTFTPETNSVVVDVNLKGLTPGEHGFHVHEKGDCSAPDASSAGGHYNPERKSHGGPNDQVRHEGDLGNLTVGKDGTAKVAFKDTELRLSGEHSIVGKSIVVHEQTDDLKSQPAGNSGKRVACGVIEAVK